MLLACLTENLWDSVSDRAVSIPEGRARETKIKQQHSIATAQTAAHNKGGLRDGPRGVAQAK